MNTENMGKKLIQLTSYKIKNSLLNLINDLAENPQPQGICIMPESYHQIYRDICRLFTELAVILEKEDRTEFGKKLTGIKKRIEETALNLNRYIFMNDYVKDILYNEYKLRETKNEDDGILLDNRIVVKNAEHFISHISNDIRGRFELGKLIAAVPLRMTREKYADYVTAGLMLMTEDTSDAFACACIERIRDMFNARPDDSLKADFPYMYEKLDIMLGTVGTMNETELIDSIQDILGNEETINAVFEIIRIYFNDIRYMQIVSAYAVDTDFLFDEDMMLKDLYYAMSNAINTEDDSLTEEISSRAVDEIDRVSDMAEALEKELNAVDKGELESAPEDIKLIMNINTAVTELFYSEVDDILMESSSDKAPEELARELAEYVNTSALSISSDLRKLMKQRFLEIIPCPMSKKEAVEYIAYALDGINDRSISLMTYGDIYGLTAYVHDHEHVHEHEHEHHRHGHEHHHHDCGCGHHH